MSDPSEPVIAARTPQRVELEPGKTYYWCRCGRSQNQPFCDGSHKVTNLKPLAFTVDEPTERALCRCKHTANAPYCDGTHTRLPAGEALPMTTVSGNSTSAAPTASAAPAAQDTADEPHVELIHELAKHGLSRVGAHGPMTAMGVSRTKLPSWDDLQLLAAQLASLPLEHDTPVDTKFVLGPSCERPLEMSMPVFVSDMSFGALSREAKIALARGAEGAGTAICSGEGGMLDAEHAESSRYLFEIGSAAFGFDDSVLAKVQAVHIKLGQAAKTGLGGHLPGAKVTAEIAAVRGIDQGVDAISPAVLEPLRRPDGLRRFVERLRQSSGGIPIGVKMSANHIEADLSVAVAAGVDFIILDGRGGATGAAPELVRDSISVPTIAALARARRWLDKNNSRGVQLIITGGLRTPSDIVKALALGADAVAVANAAIQAAGCIGARICNTNQCPSGIATQDPALRARLDVDVAAERVTRFFGATNELMSMLARVCGHSALCDLSPSDLTAVSRDLAAMAGVQWVGDSPH